MDSTMKLWLEAQIKALSILLYKKKKWPASSQYLKLIEKWEELMISEDQKIFQENHVIKDN